MTAADGGHLDRLWRQVARAQTARRHQAVVLTDDLDALLTEHTELLAYLEHVIEDERAEQAYLDAVAREHHPAAGRRARHLHAVNYHDPEERHG